MSGKSKEPTRHQLSSRLHYNAQVPAFLQKLQNRVAGVPDNDYEDDEYDEYGRDEYEHVNDGSGRPPIPRRPPIPERPADNPGSADEDEGDDDEDRDGERPQIVVLKEGKHLSEREVENERRKAKGLPLLPDVEDDKGGDNSTSLSKLDASSSKAKAKSQSQSLSFSSSGSNPKQKKRKIVGDADPDQDGGKADRKPAKKAKKAQKKLLSFGDDA